MCQQEKLTAIISPWEKLPDLVKDGFRVESLPKEKKVMVWRDDLATEKALTAALGKHGVKDVEIRKNKVTTKWTSVD